MGKKQVLVTVQDYHSVLIMYIMMNTVRTVQISSQNMLIAPYWWAAVKLMLPDRVWAQLKLCVAHLYHCTGAYCWWSLCEPAQGAWMTLPQLVSSDKTVEKCGGCKLTELKEVTKKCLCCIQLLYGRSKSHSVGDCRGVPGTTVAFSYLVVIIILLTCCIELRHPMPSQLEFI